MRESVAEPGIIVKNLPVDVARLGVGLLTSTACARCGLQLPPFFWYGLFYMDGMRGAPGPTTFQCCRNLHGSGETLQKRLPNCWTDTHDERPRPPVSILSTNYLI